MKYFNSYYELSRGLEPNVYSMDDEEIYNKIKQIVMETTPEAGRDWESKTIDDVTMKFQVKLNEGFTSVADFVAVFELLIDLFTVGKIKIIFSDLF